MVRWFLSFLFGVIRDIFVYFLWVRVSYVVIVNFKGSREGRLFCVRGVGSGIIWNSV